MTTKWWQSVGGGRIRTSKGKAEIYTNWADVSSEVLERYYGQGKDTAKPEIKAKDWMKESGRKKKHVRPKQTVSAEPGKNILRNDVKNMINRVQPVEENETEFLDPDWLDVEDLAS